MPTTSIPSSIKIILNLPAFSVPPWIDGTSDIIEFTCWSLAEMLRFMQRRFAARLRREISRTTVPWTFYMQMKWKTDFTSRTGTLKYIFPEVFCKKGVYKNLQNSQGSTCDGVSFCKDIGAQTLKSATLLKRLQQHRCFPVNFAKFFRTQNLVEDLQRKLHHQYQYP